MLLLVLLTLTFCCGSQAHHVCDNGSKDDECFAYRLREFGFSGKIAIRLCDPPCKAIDHIFSLRNSTLYEEFRWVHQGECSAVYPRIILRPESTRDVSIGVKVAEEFNLKVLLTR